MELYRVKFVNGKELEELGSDEADVREFVERSYSHFGAIESVTLVE